MRKEVQRKRGMDKNTKAYFEKVFEKRTQEEELK